MASPSPTLRLPPCPPGAMPEIETARLRLRGPRLSDLDCAAAMWSDPAMTEFVGGRPLAREDVWRRLVIGFAGHWALLGFGYWTVEAKADGRFAGQVGFADFQRGLGPALDGLPEIGWSIAPWAQGRGYASEAVAAALAWGDARFADTPTACIIHPGNGPSLQVAARAGYTSVARTAYKGDPTVILHRPPPAAPIPAAPA